MQTEARVAFNTFMMYAKVLITAGITLYSTRLILNQLGENDFGTYNLIAGIVNMLTFVNIALGVAAQRYMSYAIGKNDAYGLAEVYHVMKRISLIMALTAVIIMELAGFFFLSTLNIDPDRYFAAYIAFHCTILSAFFNIATIPYNAAVVAHEDLFVFSFIFIAESILKLCVAFYLFVCTADKLITYSILLMIIFIVSNIVQRLYCRKYQETRSLYNPQRQNKKLYREISFFTCWTALEPISTIFSAQGINILLNIFGGVVLNAAYGITTLVSSQMNYFATSLISAINPQIMRSEGMDNRERTVRLSLFACQISFFLLAFFSVPLIVEMPYVLQLWLKDVPDYTVLFCRLILISLLIAQLTYGLQSGVMSIGKIRKYQTAVCIIKLLALPIVYILLKMHFPLSVAVISFIFVETIIFVVRLYYAKKLLNINLKYYFANVFSRLVAACLTVFVLLVGLVYIWNEQSFLRLCLIALVSSIVFFILLKYLIFNREQYNLLISVVKGFIDKIKTVTKKLPIR